MQRAALLLLPLLLVAAGCGGASPDLSGVAQAAAKVEQAKTARFSFTAELLLGGKTRVTTGEGTIDSGRKRMQIQTVHGASSGELIFIGRTIYSKSQSPLFASMEKPWVKFNDPRGPDPLGEFPDPSQALEILRTAGDFEEIGRERLADIEATRYRGRVDTESEIGPKGSTVDAWVDTEGYLRRLRIHDDQVSGTIDFYDFGADVIIEPPPPDQVAELGLDSLVGPGTTAQGGVSARFFEKTKYRFDGEDSSETTRGAFDWDARRGWGMTNSDGYTYRVIQIGDVCYRRTGDAKWEKSQADDPGELCSSELFSNPATSDDLFRLVADSWTPVGEEVIDGVRTTHFRGRLNVGAVQGPFDVWVDSEGLVRRHRDAADDGGYVSVRRYYDFGTDVRVEPPTVKR